MKPTTQTKPQQTQAPKQELPPVAGAGDQAPAVIEQALPPPVSRRGITEAQWRTLKNNLYPGATNDSCLMVWDYCIARRLDPMKKPCHLVPMEVEVKQRDPKTGQLSKHYEWRDVVMPGIYEYRTTAMRTGLYLGHKEPEYGDWDNYKGVSAPAWCTFVAIRWNEKAQKETFFPVTIYFDEIVALKRDGSVNARWSRSPHQMLTKCAEAAGLREAFPDELGGEHTVEEMEGRRIGGDDDERVVSSVPSGGTRTESARDALRQRMQPKAEEPKAEPPRAETVTANAPAPDDEKDPWDGPRNDNDWASTFMGTGKHTTVKILEEMWGECIAFYSKLNKPIPEDVEAEYRLALDYLRTAKGE